MFWLGLCLIAFSLIEHLMLRGTAQLGTGWRAAVGLGTFLQLAQAGVGLLLCLASFSA